MGQLELHDSALDVNAACFGGAVSVAGVVGLLAARNTSFSYNNAYRYSPCTDAPEMGGGDGADSVYAQAPGAGGALWVGGSLGRLQLSDNARAEVNFASAAGSFASITGDVGSIDVDAASMLANGYRLLTSGEAAVYAGGSVGEARFRDSSVLSHVGGVLYALGDISSVVIANSSLSDGRFPAMFSKGNVGSVVVTNGSTVSYNDLGYLLLVGGGGLLMAAGNVDSIIISNGSAVDGHRALGELGTGGAVYVGGRLGYMEVSGGSSLSGNRARGNGGAVAANSMGSLVVTGGSVVRGNVAGDSSEIQLDEFRFASYTPARGGAVYVNTTWERLEVTHGSRLEGNQAGEGGGAVFARLLKQLELRAAEVTNNTADKGGGGGIMSGGFGHEVSWGLGAWDRSPTAFWYP